MSIKKDCCRCGICDINNVKDWDAHAKTIEHMRRVNKFNKMLIMAKIKGEHYDIKGFVKKIQNKKPKVKKKKPSGAEGFLRSISDAYTLIEFYELGSIPQRDYFKACKFALEHFRKKYGKDSFWFRELFAHMQSDDWENSFKVRSLVHAETIGCPHKTVTECDKYKNDMQLEVLAGKKCQHCGYIEGVEETWKEEDRS